MVMVKRTKKVTKNEQKSAVEEPKAVKSRKKTTKTTSSNSKDKQEYSTRMPLIAMILFAGLFVVSVFMLFRNTNYSADSLIVQDLQKLHKIFIEIDKDCKIIDFEHVKNYIDFLTVKEFVGSEVGAMNVSYPRNWKGPYLLDNPTVHEQQYIILRNKNGYYIVPGDGVTLANGKVIGQDIVLGEKTDMEKVLHDSAGLKSKEGILGVKIDVSGSYLKKILQAPLKYL